VRIQTIQYNFTYKNWSRYYHTKKHKDNDPYNAITTRKRTIKTEKLKKQRITKDHKVCHMFSEKLFDKPKKNRLIILEKLLSSIIKLKRL
jgi:hypothetical protein